MSLKLSPLYNSGLFRFKPFISSPLPLQEHMPSVLRDIILQIEPLDIQQLAQDASSDAMDAMKRTISGMLGLLPSDQFSVIVETEREALARLLVSSMMTG